MTRRGMFLVLTAALAGCGAQRFELPQRTPEVAAEEARVVALLEQRRGAASDGLKTTCAVRILEIDGATTYAWSSCTSVDANGVSGGASAPIRIDGDEIQAPADGGGYADSVREMFPERLAEEVLTHQDRLQPRSE